MKKLLLINGPNLNMLGIREPGVYGKETLTAIEEELQLMATEADLSLESFHSNAEHALIEKIHSAFYDQINFIIINPGGLTHTSISLRDALIAVSIPFIEVHISNVYAREPFRNHSYLSDKAEGVICGFGTFGYKLAFQAALAQLA